MKKYILNLKHKQLHPGVMACAILLTLFSFMIMTVSAQVGSEQKYIYLSGQLTSTNTGAPIGDHQIYISSDSLINNGFGYYATAKTDVNGFYWDTLSTTTGDGVINIYLFDFDENQIQLDRYYRFVWDTEFLMFADFSIFDPDANMELQANFMPTGDPEGNPQKVVFKDKSLGASIKSWSWEFGDGSTSTVQDPEHVYDKPGVYMVTLTINALPPEFEGYQRSTITKQVQVGLERYISMGGHVFAQYFPIDYGMVYLYIFDADNNLRLLDTTQVNPALGYYCFQTVPVGKYLTKARLIPSAALYGQFMPTYFRNAYDWNDAEQIIISDTSNFECDIWLRPSSGMAAGEGLITGQISYDTSLIIRTPVPAGNIEIVLLSAQGNFLTCGLSDNEGTFNFGNIPYGTYQLFPDVAGISTTPMFVTLSAENPLADEVNMVIYPGEITFSIPENSSAFVENAMLLYPNPVKDQARISIQAKKTSDLTVMITDLSGRTVYSQESRICQGSQEIILPVRDLPAGMYQVLLIPEDKVLISGKFLKSN
jgi:hypothetical protein